jgi:hypothetical protein
MASRPGIVDKLLQNVFLGQVPFEVVSLTGLGTGDAEKERVLKAIKKAFDDMWLREPEYDSSVKREWSRRTSKDKVLVCPGGTASHNGKAVREGSSVRHESRMLRPR